MEPPSSQYEDFTLADAYAVSAELVRLRRGRGEKTAGRKIGFTNQAIWKDCGLDTPIWAHVYESTVHFSLDGRAKLSLRAACLPRIEPEIVFKVGKVPLPFSLDPEEILGHMEWLALGFEIVDSHYSDWRFQPADAVANFGLHHALVVGPLLQVSRHGCGELAGKLAEFGVTLKKEGQKVAEGIGRNVLGNPLLALDFLNRMLKEQHEADPLAAGEIITTGTLTPAIPIAPGESWTAEIAGIPLLPLQIEFEGR